MTATERLSDRESRQSYGKPAPADVHDPVCGMIVDPANATHRSEHAGHSYCFCSRRCRESFEAEPARAI
jgi:YHS domain-containing protein